MVRNVLTQALTAYLCALGVLASCLGLIVRSLKEPDVVAQILRFDGPIVFGTALSYGCFFGWMAYGRRTAHAPALAVEGHAGLALAMTGARGYGQEYGQGDGPAERRDEVAAPAIADLPAASVERVARALEVALRAGAADTMAHVGDEAWTLDEEILLKIDGDVNLTILARAAIAAVRAEPQ